MTWSCVNPLTSLPLITMTWSPSLNLGDALSAGVLGATLDTKTGQFWSWPPFTLKPNLPSSSGFISIVTKWTGDDSSLRDDIRFGGECANEGSVANDESLSINGNDLSEIAVGQ